MGHFWNLPSRTTDHLLIWEIASKKDLAIEPDFPLRQFLWFIRPPETLEFLDKIAQLWPIVQALSKAGGTDQYLPLKSTSRKRR